MCIFFFLNDTATTEIYTLSLHDALPIWNGQAQRTAGEAADAEEALDDQELKVVDDDAEVDRKSTRLNSSHSQISYAVFCLKKKNTRHIDMYTRNYTIVHDSLDVRRITTP